MAGMIEVETALHPAGRVVLRDDVLARQQSASEAVALVPPVRLVYAATHVVMDDGYAKVKHSIDRPGDGEEIAQHVDWGTTMRLRRELDRLGFAVAEAMDTSQRFGLGWDSARRLIEECGALRLANGFVAGASTDHLPAVPDQTTLIDGVVYQAELIRAAGGEVILLPMPQLTRWCAGADRYVEVYRAIIEQIEGPIYVHWLGEMFLPELAGYFPGDSFRRVMALDPQKVRGAKLSLLDADIERRLRTELLGRDQILLTGDDFHFASLMAGESPSRAPARTTSIGSRTVPIGEFSHGLLGIFDGIARPASLALQCLARGDVATYNEIMGPCEELSRAIFASPTQFYKSGLAFLSWLNGAQDNCLLINHEETARDAAYYVEIAALAAAAGVLQDAALAAERLEQFLA